MRLRDLAFGAGGMALGICWSGTLVVHPGDDVQATVNAQPPGTTFVLRPGVYRLQSITPKDNDVFLGESGAVLNGARLLNEFRREGGYWVADGRTPQGAPGAAPGVCQPQRPRCAPPQDLFLDHEPLEHVPTLEQVRPGRWYFDYERDRIYFADDPAGRTVEISVAPYAFTNARRRGVTIRGLVIEKYANPAGSGAIQFGEYWRVENNEIRLTHGLGVRVDDGMQVVGNRIHHNGQMGLGGSGADILVEGNEIAWNNRAGYDWGWEAGGTKFVLTTDLVVRDNWVHDNQGPGLWADYSNYRWLLEANRTSRNLDAGILIEISYRGVARFNVVESDGLYGPNSTPRQNSFWYRGGIMVANSPDVEVYGNSVLKCPNGIGAVNANRGSGYRGPFVVQNLQVHDNVIVQHGGWAAGLVAEQSLAASYTLWNNRFAGNQYKLTGPAGEPYYVWAREISRSQWQQAGQDPDGVWRPGEDHAFPRGRFREGQKVRLARAAELRRLPSVHYGMLVGNEAAGSLGAISRIRGPIYFHGIWWWHVEFPSGTGGWVEESALADP